MRLAKPLAAAAAGWCMIWGPAAAQTPVPPAGGEVPHDCRVEPGPRSEGRPPSTTDGQLSETLEKCGGVLRPPPGDGKIVEPAPDAGKTPVIPPGAVPEQPPAQPK